MVGNLPPGRFPPRHILSMRQSEAVARSRPPSKRPRRRGDGAGGRRQRHRRSRAVGETAVVHQKTLAISSFFDHQLACGFQGEIFHLWRGRGSVVASASDVSGPDVDVQPNLLSRITTMSCCTSTSGPDCSNPPAPLRCSSA